MNVFGRPLTVEQIASALRNPDRKAADREILPPWMDMPSEEQAAFFDAHKQVQELRRQRNGLVEIWPHKQMQLDEEFRDATIDVAAEFKRKVEECA